MNRTFQIYPRGFVGAVQADASQQVSGQALARIDPLKLNFGGKSFSVPKQLPCNRTVVELHRELLNNSYKAATFQFYERVLVAALQAFGTPDFREWLSAQAQASTTDYMHARFLKDTMMYLAEGRREVMIDTWNMLLSGPHNIQNTTANTDKTQADFKALLAYAQETIWPDTRDAYRYHDVKYIVFEWVQRPSGVVDLLKTLNIMFGESA